MRKQATALGFCNLTLILDQADFPDRDEISQIQSWEQLEAKAGEVIGLKERIKLSIDSENALDIVCCFNSIGRDKTLFDFLSLSCPQISNKFLKDLVNNKLLQNGIFNVDLSISDLIKSVTLKIVNGDTEVSQLDYSFEPEVTVDSILKVKYDFSSVSFMIVDIQELIQFFDLIELNAIMSFFSIENKIKLYCIMPELASLPDESEAELFNLMSFCELLIWDKDNILEFLELITEKRAPKHNIKAKELFFEEQQISSFIELYQKQRARTKKVLLLEGNAVRFIEFDQTNNFRKNDCRVSVKTKGNADLKARNVFLGVFLNCFVKKSPIKLALEAAVKVYNEYLEFGWIDALKFKVPRAKVSRRKSAEQLKTKENKFCLDSVNLKKSRMREYNAKMDENLQFFFEGKKVKEAKKLDYKDFLKEKRLNRLTSRDVYGKTFNGKIDSKFRVTRQSFNKSHGNPFFG